MTTLLAEPPITPKASIQLANETPSYALIGNPNSGKTTLFNALTGLRQKTGNYSGVTVSKKCGFFYSQHGRPISIVDLPGTYSLITQALDETIAKEVLLGHISEMPQPERILCTLDASTLGRNLYLLECLAELGKPIIVALTMTDIAKDQGIQINHTLIEKAYNITVIPCQPNKAKGLRELRIAMSKAHLPVPKAQALYPEAIERAISTVQNTGEAITSRGEAILRLCEGAYSKDTAPLKPCIQNQQAQLEQEDRQWKLKLIQTRYSAIKKIAAQATQHLSPLKSNITDTIDKIALHPTAGWMLLAGTMGLLFWTVFSLSSYPMHWVETSMDAIILGINQVMPDNQIRNLLTGGVITGVGNVLLFLPQILLLFLFIGLLESSGYLPRAVFLMDKLMNRVGLQGKSFIPLLSSYACAIPGIMATRTLKSEKERLATIFVAPWMSCSARIPVYLLLIATMLPSRDTPAWLKASIFLGAYALGTMAAFATAWLVRKTIFKGKPSEAITELPDYRLPCWRNLGLSLRDKAATFIKEAGTFILGFSIIFWFLTAYPRVDTLSPTSAFEQSYAGKLGSLIEPVIEPLGFDGKMGISIISSFAARELFVSTMAITYNLQEEEGVIDIEDPKDRLQLTRTLLSQKNTQGDQVYTPLTCLSLIVFYIFALQCMSTLIIVKKETGSLKWPIIQFIYMTGTAYLAALIVFQLGQALGYT